MQKDAKPKLTNHPPPSTAVEHSARQSVVAAQMRTKPCTLTVWQFSSMADLVVWHYDSMGVWQYCSVSLWQMST